MAATSISLTKLTLGELNANPSLTAVSSADGALIEPGADGKSYIMLSLIGSGTPSAVVTVKGGGGVMGGADLVKTISSAGTKLLVLESGRYVITDPDDSAKGKIKVLLGDVSSGATVSAASVTLP